MFDKQDSIGVVIPTFNRLAETIAAIDSILNQSLPVSQIVVVDDGSDEEIFLQLQNHLSKKPVELIRITHTGHPGIVREAGRKKLRTEWIAFLDSDDSWHIDKLEVTFLNQKRYSADALCSLASGVNTKNQKKTGSRFLSRKEIFRSNQIINSSVVIRSSILDSVGGIATSYSVRGCEDYATWLRVSDVTAWLLISDELISYRDDSKDSVRRDEEFNQDFSNITALLDYVLFSQAKKGKRFISLRMILRYLWRLIL
jgi:glycosyltransferase involved in cell wall biosynthesis